MRAEKGGAAMEVWGGDEVVSCVYLQRGQGALLQDSSSRFRFRVLHSGFGVEVGVGFGVGFDFDYDFHARVHRSREG